MKGPYFRELIKALDIAAEAARRKVTVRQVMEEKARRESSRREFLQKTLMASAVAAVPPALLGLGARRASATGAPTVAIVGAGLAGLTCAYRLKQGGIDANVYEASPRLGGRCSTNRTTFADGQTCERGGELVNSQDDELLGIASELGLQLDDLWALETGTSQVILDGQVTSFDEVYAGAAAVVSAVNQDNASAGPDTFYYDYTPGAHALDNMSLTDWINTRVPGGTGSLFGRFLETSVTADSSVEASQLSALTSVRIMHEEQNNNQHDGHDERYHIHGGNDLLVTGMAGYIGSSRIRTGCPLTCIRRNANGTFTLDFSGGNPSVTVDYVVVALPVSTLRDVDLSQSGFRALKKQGIQQLGVGTASKLSMQFTDRHWQTLGRSGLIFNTNYHWAWDGSSGQPGTKGILTNFAGGNIGNSYGVGGLNTQVNRLLPLLNQDLPGLAGKYNGKAALDYWPGYQWAKGSYSNYKVGQVTRFRGIFGEPEGNCFFAGEYTSLKHQSFLNGGCDSGARAAADILDRVFA